MSPGTPPPPIPISNAHVYFPRVNAQQVPAHVCTATAKYAWAHALADSRSYQKVEIPLTPFPFTQHILLSKTTFPIKINPFLLSCAITPADEWKNLGTNSALRLHLPPLPTVKWCLDGKRITALLPTWDACWGFIVLVCKQPILLKCWRAMAKCRDGARVMQILLWLGAAWLFLDNTWHSSSTLRCQCATVKLNAHTGVNVCKIAGLSPAARVLKTQSFSLSRSQKC